MSVLQKWTVIWGRYRVHSSIPQCNAIIYMYTQQENTHNALNAESSIHPFSKTACPMWVQLNIIGINYFLINC